LDAKNKLKAGNNSETQNNEDEFEWIIPGIVVKVLPH
jgi:hypothetical protein